MLFSHQRLRLLFRAYCIIIFGAIASIGISPVAIAQTEINTTHEVLPEQVEEFLGEMVTLRGSVIKILEDGNFWIEGEPLVTGKNILVINATGGPIPQRRYEYTDLQITGEVRQLEIATIVPELSEEYGLDFDRALYVNYETYPVIIAQSIAIAPSPGDITSHPDWYYNRSVVVEGRVAEVFNQRFLTIAEEQLYGGQDLLVAIPQTNISRLQEEQRIVVTGTIRPFVAIEIERDYNLNSDLPLMRQLEADYIANPILMVEHIYIID